MTQKEHYVNNDMLRLELIASHVKNQLTTNCLEMLVLMIDGIQSQFTYKNQADKEDCKSHAIEIVLRKWKQCDVERKNPFAYFTRVIYNALYAGWNILTGKTKTVSISAIFQESI